MLAGCPLLPAGHGKPFPVLLRGQQRAVRGVGLGEAAVGALSVEQSYGISLQCQMGAPQTFHLKRTLLDLRDLLLVAAKS